MPKRDQLVTELYRMHYEELLRKASILLHDEEDARDAGVLDRLEVGGDAGLRDIAAD